MFQHTLRITPEASYLAPDDVLHVASASRGQSKVYRKAQVHTSVYIQAIKSAVSCSSIPVGANECLVILTGGTPEAAVAAITQGFNNVLYVAHDKNEYDMMYMPTANEEREYNLDYHAYLEEGGVTKFGFFLIGMRGCVTASIPRSILKLFLNNHNL